MPRELGENERKELEAFLEENGISMYKINRELSDAVAVALLIRKYFPKLVNMSVYPSRCNTQLKLYNWDTLNKNALTKLGVGRSPLGLEKLAKGSPGAIEQLLYDIMQLDELEVCKRERNLQKFHDPSKVVTVKLFRKFGGEEVPVEEKMISYRLYEDVVARSEEKERLIRAAEDKLRQLEMIIMQK